MKDGDVADDIPLDEFEELEDPAGPRFRKCRTARPPATSRPRLSRRRRTAEQFRDVADPGERGDRGRDVPVAERAPRGARRERPFEQQRKSRAVHPRDAGEVHFDPLEAGESGVALGEQARRVGEADVAGELEAARTRRRERAGRRRAVSARVRRAPTWFSFSSRAITASSPVWSTSVPTSFLKLRT